MKSILVFTSSLLLLLACNGQSSETEDNSSKLKKSEIAPKVDALVEQYMDLDIFSGVVLIAEKGKPVYHKAFGLANREKNIPNTIDTRFDIGSMNKSFTKVVVLQLVSEGKLDLNDPLGKFLDGFPPEAAGNVTVKHLLDHGSGYGDYHNKAYFEMPIEQKTIEGKLRLIRDMSLMFKPGTDRSYSNAGYIILGAIIQKVTGKSYYDVVEERIVDPLGMEDTYLREKYTVPKRAIGYLKNMRGELENNEFFQEKPNPDGGFYSTTSDMLKFYRAFYYGDELWDEQTRKGDEMYEFYSKHMDSGGAMVQAGGFNGANTVHYEILRDQISVVVFANMDEPVAERLGEGILAIIRGKEPEKPALPAVQAAYKAYKEKGIDYLKQNFDTLTVNFHPADPKDLILNQIGYNLLYSGEVKDAIKIFKLNTELFPDVANTLDSYGEALLESGEEKAAKAAYRKALEIKPDLKSALQAIDKLE